MRNPLNLRNAATPRYLETYVENRYASENTFVSRSRRNVDPWPTFDASRDTQLPLPHLPALPRAADCYHHCWQIAFKNFRRATNENGFVSDYSSTMYDDALFIWDSVFITLFGRYADRAWTFQHISCWLCTRTGPMTTAKTVKAGYRLLGAIIENLGGNVFLKFTGPEKVITTNQQKFEQMLESFVKE